MVKGSGGKSDEEEKGKRGVGEYSPGYSRCPEESMEDDYHDVEGSQSGSDEKSGSNDDHSDCDMTTDRCSDVSANKDDSQSCTEEEGDFSDAGDKMSDDGKKGYDSGSGGDESNAQSEGFTDNKVRWCFVFLSFKMCQFTTHQMKQGN